MKMVWLCSLDISSSFGRLPIQTPRFLRMLLRQTLPAAILLWRRLWIMRLLDEQESQTRQGHRQDPGLALQMRLERSTFTQPCKPLWRKQRIAGSPRRTRHTPPAMARLVRAVTVRRVHANRCKRWNNITPIYELLTLVLTRAGNSCSTRVWMKDCPSQWNAKTVWECVRCSVPHRTVCTPLVAGKQACLHLCSSHV